MSYNIGMKMERVAEVIRGWPYDGSLDLYEPIAAGTTLVNGDWVIKQPDNTVALATDETAAAGLVIVGNGDSGSAATTNKAVVLWGNFVANISNHTAGTYVPGDKVAVVAGKIAKATGTDVIGTVLNVIAASSTETEHITVKIN